MASNKNFSILADVKLDTSSIQKQLDKCKFKIKLDVDTRDFKKTFSNITGTGKVAKTASQDVKALSASLKEATSNAKKLSTAAEDAAKGGESLMVSYQVANTIMTKSVEAISAMVDQVYELDGAVTDFKKVSDLSGTALDNYTGRLTEMGKQVGRTGSEMVQAATEFKKSGFDEEEAANLALVATQFQNVADDAISAGEASNFIISQLKAFNIEAENSQHVIDALNEVSNNFAVSSSDLKDRSGV